MEMSLVDVSRAHFNALSKEKTYVQLPDEVHEPGRCGRLVYNLYGTRMAASAWEADYGEKMVQQWGFERGGSCPCIFRHTSRPICVIVHGDDFVILGDDEQIDWFKGRMNTAYQCKEVGRIGPEEGDAKSMRLLNRIIEWREDGIHLEADQRHAEIIIKELGLEDAKGSDVPGSKDK